MKKRATRILALFCLIACVCALPAFAGSSSARYSFTLASSSTYSYSSAAYKSDAAQASGAYASVTPDTGLDLEVQQTYRIKTKAQLTTNSFSSSAVTVSGDDDFSIPYYSTSISNGNKYLCAKLNSSSGVSVEVRGYWYP